MAATVNVDPEVESLMQELKNYFVWRTKLLAMLGEGNVSQSVFSKLFDEYQQRIDQLSQRRTDKVKLFDEQSSSTKNELDQKELELEELKVRREVGQIDDAALDEKSPSVQGEIDRLSEDHNSANIHLARLGNLLQGMSTGQILELENMTKQSQSRIHESLESGVIGRDSGNSISRAFDDATAVFDSLLAEKRDKQKTLEEELSAIETRHKVGEVSDSNFEMRRTELQSKMRKIWEL